MNYDNMDAIKSLIIGKKYLQAIKLIQDDKHLQFKILLWACKFNDYNFIKLLLEKTTIDPSKQNNEAIIMACKIKSIELVKMFMEDKRVDPSANSNQALYNACVIVESSFRSMCYIHTDSYEIIKLLLTDKRVDSGSHNNILLCQSLYFDDYLKLFKKLLKDTRINPADRQNDVFISACESGIIDAVRLLIDDARINPSDQNNLAIHSAFRSKQYNIGTLLLRNVKVQQTLTLESIKLFLPYTRGLFIIHMLLYTKIIGKSAITFIMTSNLINYLNKDIYSFIVGIMIEKQIKELHGYQSTSIK